MAHKITITKGQYLEAHLRGAESVRNWRREGEMMAYPEPIPTLNKKEWDKFLKELKEFELTDEQKEFYRDALKRFGKKCPGDCKGHFVLDYCFGCSRLNKYPDKYKKYDPEKDKTPDGIFYNPEGEKSTIKRC